MAVFLELLVKSSLIATAALALTWALPHLLKVRAAKDQVDVLRAATVLLVLLPVFLAVAPRLTLAWLAPAEAGPGVAPIAPLTDQPWRVDLAPMADVQVSGLGPSALPWEAIAGLAYGLVAALLIGRFILGVLTLSRWTNEGRAAPEGVWTQTLRRLGGRTARLVVAPGARGPLSWGPPPGVILIQPQALRHDDQAEAVLAHELAHIRRGDWLFLALSRLAVALFWFNPLVWVLHHQLAARTEDAADEAALKTIEPRTYARALVALATDTACPAALSLGGAPSSLQKRIERIMSDRKSLPSRPLTLGIAVAALIAVATPLAAVELTRQSQEPEVPAAPPAPPAPPAAFAHVAPPAPPAPPAAIQEWEAPVPPAPPAPPSPPEGWSTRHVYFEGELDPETRRAVDQARARADAARAQADVARREADRARVEAHRAIASIDHDEIARTVAEARVQAAQAQVEARQAMAEARVHMREGAEDMVKGARQMREEAQRLRDPAYRAKVIAENRERGSTVTDAQLVEMTRTLPDQAADMERQAQRMREQAEQD